MVQNSTNPFWSSFCDDINNTGMGVLWVFFLQAVYSMDGDTLVEKQTGSGFDTTNKRSVSGNTMTMVGPARRN